MTQPELTLPLQKIDVRGSTSAPPSEVFALLDDSTTWPSWTPLDSCELERTAGPDGVGEIRVFRNGRYRLREEIIERIPDRRVSYTVLTGLGVRDYRADIDLSPGTHGTEIHWHTTFRPKVPGTGWIYRRALDKATREFVDGLVKRTAGRAAA